MNTSSKSNTSTLHIRIKVCSELNLQWLEIRRAHYKTVIIEAHNVYKSLHLVNALQLVYNSIESSIFWGVYTGNVSYPSRLNANCPIKGLFN